jgi:hypothetical protein
MGFPIRKLSTVATTGNLDTLVATTRTPGATVAMGVLKPGSLCAEVTVDAETSTLTIYADWQVSDDATTWLLLAPENNAANVVLATGTGGADAAVTKVIPAPAAAYSFRYARCAVRNEVATGAATDTYSIKYHYLKPTV